MIDTTELLFVVLFLYLGFLVLWVFKREQLTTLVFAAYTSILASYAAIFNHTLRMNINVQVMPEKVTLSFLILLFFTCMSLLSWGTYLINVFKKEEQ